MAKYEFNLTPSDLSIINQGTLIKIVGSEPISGFPGGGNSINFQFPPKIKQDNKSNRWFTIYDSFYYEPQYIYMGGSARKLDISATYIVGGPKTGGKSWDAAEVAEELRRWKSYFYVGGPEQADLPVFSIIMYNQIPEAETVASFRSRGVRITHGEEIIKDDSGIHPLRSDVVLGTELVTNINFPDGTSKFVYDELKPVEQVWY